jgi:hypothetical protein
MANLSNINGKFVVEQTTGYVGVGTTDPSYPIEVLNASAEIALNASGGSIYRLRSDSTDSFRINKNGVGDRLVIDGSGNSTFSGQVKVDSTNPIFLLNESDQTANNRLWGFQGQQTLLKIRAYPDDLSSAVDALILTRTGNATFAGNVTTGGQVTVPSGYSVNIGTSRIHSAATSYLLGGNVGIGTTTPGTILDVSYGASASNTAAINLNGDNGAAAELVMRAGGDDGGTIYNRRAAIRYYSNQISTTTAQWVNGVSMSQTTGDDKFYFNNSGNSTVLCLQQNGNVGIGKTPQSDARLHTYRNSTDAYNIFESSTNRWVFGEAGGVCQVGGRYGHHSGIQIDTVGNVGIGTSSPGEKLEVDGNAELKGNLIINKFSTTAPYADGEIRFTGQYDRYVGGIKTYSDNASYPDYANGLDFFVQRHVYALPNGHLAMRIDSDGKVGIGNSDPSRPLDISSDSGAVALKLRARTNNDYSFMQFFNNAGTTMWSEIYASGTASAVTALHFSVGTTTTERMRIDSSGLVSLTESLQIANTKNVQFIGSSGDHARITYTQGNGTTGDVWSHSFYQNSGFQASMEFFATTEAAGDGNIRFKTGATERMRINSSGDVGVGVTNPVAKLDVNGSDKIKTRELSWYRCGAITSTDAYRHIKTTLAGNGMHIMGGIIVTGYAYGTALYGEGSCMFHNSANTIYSLSVTNRGSWGTFVQSPYLSSDNYIVFVLRHNTYAQPILDLYQYYTPYPWRNISVSAETTSNSTTGVY